MKPVPGAVLSVAMVACLTQTVHAQNSDTIPEWVRGGIAGFRAEGRISDAEFTSAMEFLIKNGIVDAGPAGQYRHDAVSESRMDGTVTITIMPDGRAAGEKARSPINGQAMYPMTESSTTDLPLPTVMVIPAEPMEYGNLEEYHPAKADGADGYPGHIVGCSETVSGGYGNKDGRPYHSAHMKYNPDPLWHTCRHTADRW